MTVKKILLCALAVAAVSVPANVSAQDATGDGSDPTAGEVAVRTSYTIDNCLQFAPAAAVLALDLTSVKSEYGLRHRMAMRAVSALLTAGVSKGLKSAVSERRPDGSDHRAFPSGHAAIAFMGAEMLWQEHRHASPWIWVGGYAAATATAVLRVHHKRHYVHDVIAGAAIGVGCTKLVYWLYPKVVRGARQAPGGATLTAVPFYDGHAAGCLAMLTF